MSEEHRYSNPRINIVEDDKVFTIEAEMPGVAKDGVTITVKERELTLSGTRANGHRGGYRLHERPNADFHRAFTLGDTVDTAGISAVMRDGVLTMTLRKTEASKSVSIQVSQ